MAKAEDGYRFDAMSGEWIAVVPGRRKAYTKVSPRPAELPTISGRCPFCPGHEADTERTVARSPDEGPWRVRVVDNLYPLVTKTAEIDAHAGFEARAARGIHEVVIEHPDHDIDMPDYDDAHFEAVLRMYRDRMGALSRVSDVASVTAFRNRGRRAGSSQPHPHGQIVAVTVNAPRIDRRHARAREHYATTGETLLFGEVRGERRTGTRVIEEHRGFVAYVPFASRQNHHVRIALPNATGAFWSIDDETVASLADVLRRSLARVRVATDAAPYNILFESPPAYAEDDPAAFWFIDVLPRRGGHAGFELATGIEIVTVLPERAAERLRQAPTDSSG